MTVGAAEGCDRPGTGRFLETAEGRTDLIAAFGSSYLSHRVHTVAAESAKRAWLSERMGQHPPIYGGDLLAAA